MVDVVTHITIKMPLKGVADFACNPDNAPKWYVNIKTVEWETPKPLVIGTCIAFTAHFLGKKLSYTYEIVEFSSTKFVIKTAEGPFPMQTTNQFEKIDENITKMSLRNCGDSTGFSNLFSPIMSLMMKKANQKDLLKLKTILENKF